MRVDGRWRARPFELGFSGAPPSFYYTIQTALFSGQFFCLSRRRDPQNDRRMTHARFGDDHEIRLPIESPTLWSKLAIPVAHAAAHRFSTDCGQTIMAVSPRDKSRSRSSLAIESNPRLDAVCAWRAAFLESMTSTLLALIARFLSGASVRWIGCQPESRQRVYFANHTSHLDAIVLWSAMPYNLRSLVRPVAAKDYWERGVARRYMARTFNALLIDRTDIKVHQSPVDLMLREIGHTYSLIMFPEGSRNIGSELAEFKSGLYYLSKKRPDLELVPVHIDNLNRVLPRGEFLPVPLLSCISFGAPIRLEPGEAKSDFLARAQDAVRKLKEL